MTTQLERVDAPPRKELLRMAPFALRAADDDTGGDGLTLDGWAAVFNRETVIDSWEGRFREQLAPGSMRKSFRTLVPRVQFDHGHHPVIGSIPIGRVESIREEADPEFAPEGGAHLVARLHDNWLTEPVRDAIESQAVDGMSFRFTVVREQWADAEGKPVRDLDEVARMLRQTLDADEDELMLRTLREVKVPELGPVVFPAYEMTSVGVRDTVTIDLGHISERSQQRKLTEAMFLADAAERERQLGLLGRIAREEIQSEFSDTQPEGGHLSGTTEDEDTRSEDAQPQDGHPSGTGDAQPSSGHPSEPSETTKGLRDEIQQWVAFSKQHLASIQKGD